jgi:hypothetical protein
VNGARSLGQIAYEGYCERADGVSLVSGEQLPGWDDLSPVIAEAWEAAAQAVVSAGREDPELR